MRSRAWRVAAPAILGLCVLVSALPVPDRVLFRVEKTDIARMPANMADGLFVVKELATALIAAGPESLLGSLAASGIPAEILDREIDGKSYFLVLTPHPGAAEVLSKFGTAVPLDGRTSLFRTEYGEAREILPPGFRLKRLSLDRPVTWTIVPEYRDPIRPIQARISPDPRISDWVAQVSQTRLADTIQSLQDFQTRYASTLACENSGTFLFDEFARLGLACAYEPFTFSYSQFETRNIVATLPGKTAPQKTVIVCAHYDSYSNKASTQAPGADDNASGVAAVLEIAHVLREAPLDYTVKFVCFSAEEWGLYGSAHYAREARERGENIVGVINMDMIAYTNPSIDGLEIYVNSGSNWLGSRYLEAALTYAPLEISKIVDASAEWSDHSSFWDEDFSALCAIEEAADWNPNYHRVSDTLDKLNMSFCLSVTRASLAATADLARPVSSGPQPPTGLQSRSQVVSSLFAAVKSVSLNWDAGPASVAGYNVYRKSSSNGGFEKVNPELLLQPLFAETMLSPGTTYYYAVTAVDGLGRESDYSDEVRDDQDNVFQE